MIARNDLGGTSSKTLHHWDQLARSSRFAQFDYGYEGNLGQYGQGTPPDYDLKSFKERMRGLKMMIVVGNNDSLVNTKDLQMLLDNLPETVQLHFIEDYNHIDYMWARDSNTYVNDRVR